MAEGEWNGLRTGPVTSFLDTSKSTPGDQLHLLSQPNNDQPSDLILSPGTDLALSKSEASVARLASRGNDGWSKKWSIALVAIAMATPWVIFQKLADSTEIVVPKQTVTETTPAVVRQSGETLLAPAEQNRPPDSTNGISSTPTPDDIAAVTKSVGQGRDPPPQALATTQRPARLIDREELANLLNRGRYLLSIGDIAPARLLLERAADANDASAAFDLAGTYDPEVLTRSHVLGIAPDLAIARMWYEKALKLGHSEAQQRLAQLQK
jgi:hypothetical protein